MEPPLTLETLRSAASPDRSIQEGAPTRGGERRPFRLASDGFRVIEAGISQLEGRLALQGVPVPEPLLGVGVR